MREVVIEINKDIDRYQETVAMGLTAKQLLFSVASVVVGGGMVLLLYKYIGLTSAPFLNFFFLSVLIRDCSYAFIANSLSVDT